MINTYRIIIMFIVLNLAVALSIDVYHGTTNSWNEAQSFANQSNVAAGHMQNNELFSSSPRTDVQITEASLFVKIWRLIGTIAFFLWTAINPLSIPYWHFTNLVERTAVILLSLVRGFLMMVIAMEIWSYFINKKQP